MDKIKIEGWSSHPFSSFPFSFLAFFSEDGDIILDLDSVCHLSSIDISEIEEITQELSKVNFLNLELPINLTNQWGMRICINDITFIFEEEKEKKCTCGAKFTSNPNYHYDWCDLQKKENNT
jgi:hypothetical protein